MKRIYTWKRHLQRIKIHTGEGYTHKKTHTEKDSKARIHTLRENTHKGIYAWKGYTYEKNINPEGIYTQRDIYPKGHTHRRQIHLEKVYMLRSIYPKRYKGGEWIIFDKKVDVVNSLW